MASKEIERLRTAVARRATDIKDLLDDPDLGDLTIVLRSLEATSDLQKDIMELATSMMERREEDFERDRDRFEDRRDGRNDRGREWRGGRDGRGGGRYSRR